ncbi:carbon-nitrogen hydrolase family protein [Pseudarthrobacter sp. NamE2]|uniref:carbon-nitrogen hydrolase family protein n=1 Tax=Pseudarthrobacter sp. NamE2 TaxID=2576838 RepID=UPI0010FD6355|nr:carbon-nitrogen hydrolase family protein [Pseudarthrobacter sp. NamE2]TLM80730.1 carbon-nitrogen hydrolase family protein [Pseudarthrobacter sp. NamE2]
MKIALGQLASGSDIAANLAAIERFAAAAAGDGAELVAFPEYATYEKKVVDASFPAVAEPLDGPVCRALAATAARHSIALVAGVVETSPEPGKAYNTLAAFGPDGGRLASYRKIHLFDAQGFDESRFIAPGPSLEPVVFETGGIKFGLLTCYDLRFPELARALADAGAQALLVPSSWVPGTHKTEQWMALNAARAIENSVYVAGICQAPPVSVGRSVLVDQMGFMEEDLGLEPGVRTVEVSLDTVARVREQFPMFRQRRL